MGITLQRARRIAISALLRAERIRQETRDRESNYWSDNNMIGNYTEYRICWAYKLDLDQKTHSDDFWYSLFEVTVEELSEIVKDHEAMAGGTITVWIEYR